MEEEVRKKLKNFDDVLLLLNDMIRNIDSLMETIEYNPGGQDKAHKESDNMDIPGNSRMENP